ncbi:transcriptional regulator BetI [Paraglaciecola chathamensis]|jgi:TetR/AcrR family transcriptional repressor of bet genes|uniref:HTH-type transcriptional regulator BetI n=3 Tax=Paraglaciecola chathamensis TaxID=368405 RepID=A0A8H9IDU7_9ALTE|nr:MULTISPECIES: transcriptional regulator BetI [Paraglaciecola]MBN23670.1 transcriptional regulator BetI [Alteromonadaceae bacterium]MDO6560963.1 transcriptional regulator BetI [Paraglaciecola chathamensis]MDO6842014.1 transcriptional regulator BetI [Paraglaciecola chathamensis]GAC04052.1 TetR/AcrR family transcriptional regulator, transcriptional repressor of bet genes [Paraglaciecola agarilytica NO2]GGZ82050.1 HTH-type transcriptional regulator BetI [Paraglaciecola oceanifecundans]|tara:strand:- start:9262 stop:9852 length:591 start_codon:yes stop_codon:yes gene_type:complete
MPKVGMQPVRRQQLIDATIESVAELGLRATTINSISKKAGLSSGIISHYFGGKQGLIEATVRYLLSNLKQSLLGGLKADTTPEQRLMLIVEANFSRLQQQSDATKTWLSFWAQSMHDIELHRLQNVNSRRLCSNLACSFRQLMSVEDARVAAELSAAMIDGLWLRAVLSKSDKDEFEHCERLAKDYVRSLIKQYGH